MPRRLKRRADAIDEDAEDSASASPEPPRRRRRSASASSSSASEAEVSSPEETQSTSAASTLIKKLVRLALSTEYARTPLRRADISTKILGEAHSRQFKPVFAGAQKILRETFGMELVELPSREKTTLKDRRAQATQNAARKAKETQDSQSKPTNASSSKSWILTSILPDGYKHSPVIVTPTRAPTQFAESTYTGLYTVILSLIYLNNGALAENKLERYLKRFDADEHTPLELTLEKTLQKMSRDGYVEKRRNTSMVDEVVEWVVGPRGKIEVGAKGVAGLVKSVYGFGPTAVNSRGDENDGDAIVKDDEDELDTRLARSLGLKDLKELDRKATSARDGETDEAGERQQRRRGRPRRGGGRDESDDDD